MTIFGDQPDQTYLQRTHCFEECEEVIYDKIAGS